MEMVRGSFFLPENDMLLYQPAYYEQKALCQQLRRMDRHMEKLHQQFQNQVIHPQDKACQCKIPSRIPFPLTGMEYKAAVHAVVI